MYALARVCCQYLTIFRANSQKYCLIWLPKPVLQLCCTNKPRLRPKQLFAVADAHLTSFQIRPF